MNHPLTAYPPRAGDRPCKIVSAWADLAATYYDAVDGRCWTYNRVTRSWVNAGSLAEHTAAIQTGRVRGKLFGDNAK